MAGPGTRAATVIALCLQALPAVAQVSTPFFHPIPRLNREIPAEELFGIQGYVAMLSECPPCPKDAVCAPCLPPSIIVSSRNRPIAFPDQMTAQEVRLLTNQLTGFVRGQHYRFTVKRASGADSGQPRVFDLVGFQRAPATKPALTRVDDVGRIARVRAVVQERLGNDVSVDRLPVNPTLERGLRYLTTASSRDTVRGALTGVPTVYGLELEATFEQERVRVFVYATRPDFAGEFVYAVSLLGDAWPVFIHRSAPR